jgi:hypothetical protein
MSQNVNLDDFFSTLIGELSSPGKGKKICPSCSEINGARTQICKCGYSFLDGTSGNKPKEKVIHIAKTFDGPGKGRQQCPSCKKYVGARSLECPICGIDIKSFKEKERKQEKVVDQSENQDIVTTVTAVDPDKLFAILVGGQITSRVVYAPSGECKFKLKSTDKKSVEQWCCDVVKSGLEDNLVYLPQAIKYWLRFEYPIGTNEYAECSKIIDNWANELQSVNEVSENSEGIE